MRKLTLFLLVFGLGLLALVLVDRATRSSRAREDAERPALEVPEIVEDPAPVTEPRPRVEAPEGQEGVHVQLEGPLSFTSFAETGKKNYTFDSRRVEPLEGGAYDAHGLTIEAFDPVSAERRVTVLAARGRLRIDSRSGGGPRLADEGRVELFDVVVTQHTGGPLVPLVFRADHLIGHLDNETFETPDESEGVIEGVGLSGRGRGLRFDGRGGEFSLLRGGSVFFSADAERPVSFSTPGNGPLHIQRLDEKHLSIRASEGIELALQTEPVGRVTAREAELFARIEEKNVFLERATFVGDVEAIRGTDRFAGDRARLAFGGQNELRELDLEGSPEWQLTLESDQEGVVEVEGEGEGPLSIDWLGALHFEMQGVSEFRVPSRDLVVRAADGMSGSVAEDERRGEFRARKAVRLVHAGWDVETEELLTELRANGEMSAVGRGLTRLAGADDLGQPVDLTAADGVELRGLDDHWRVVLARGVELLTTGEDASRTRAGVLRDLDWEQVTFSAEAGVSYSSPLGNGRADRADVRGRKDFDLYGSEAERARFRVTPPPNETEGLPNVGEFEAERIVVRENSVDAQGRVSATLAAEGRTYRLESEGLRVDIEPLDQGDAAFVALASKVQRASLREEGLDVVLSADELVLSGTWRSDLGQEQRQVDASDAVATGSVEIEYFGEFEVGAAGHRFILERDGSGRIEAEAGRRVSAWGRFPQTELPYEMTADWVEFDDDRVRAPAPRVFVDARLLPLGDPLADGASFTQAQADWLVADRDGVLLTGEVHLAGVDTDGRGLNVEAQMLRLLANSRAYDEGASGLAVVERFEAWGDFRATYQGNAVVYGEYCLASESRLLLEGSPARVEILGLALESAQIDVDLDNFLLTSERGILRSKKDLWDWSIEFASVRPIQDGDETMVVLLAPVYTARNTGARADWAVLWIDSESWRATGREMVWGEPNPRANDPVAAPLPGQDLVPNIFRQLHKGELSDFGRALYLEGEAEVTESGAREARADAIFIDMVSNQAWMKNAELIPKVEFGSRVERLRTRAEEVHTAADGTLRAARASLSACSHEVPHYQVETGELILEPREGGSWRLSARKNRLLFAGGLQVPIPSIGRAVLDPEGDLVGFESESGELITFDRLVFGRTARYGTAVATAFQRDIGKVGKAVSSAAGFTDNVRGKWDYEAAWLSSRGPLGRVGLLLSEKKQRHESEEEFWLNMYVSAVPDTGTDRGLIRVPDDERDTLRTWFNARGRYPISNTEWLDLAFTKQSDVGVQSEFYEGEFLDYEERDNYLHWRKARSTTYLDAAVSVRLEDFRTQVEELPSAGLYRGATPLAHIAGQPILWEGTLDVDNMRRKEATPSDSPQVFGDGIDAIFDDGLGDRDVLRIDNSQRVTMPFELGGSGIRATPFFDADLTAWDQGEVTTDNPTRVALFAGAEFAAAFWKLRNSGFIHEIAPRVSFRGDVLIDESGGQPVVFDARDRLPDGKEVAVGLRSRWWVPGETERFDIEVVGSHGYDRQNGLPDLKEVGVLGGLETDLRSTPFVLLYDLRFDLVNNTTSYSRTTVGSRPIEDLALEVSHDRGLDVDGEQLYEAATVAGRFRFSPKWEVEARQTISFLNDGSLSNEFSLRRFSHDFLLEIRVGYRAGEGTSFSFNLAPLLAWRRRGLGRLGF